MCAQPALLCTQYTGVMDAALHYVCGKWQHHESPIICLQFTECTHITHLPPCLTLYLSLHVTICLCQGGDPASKRQRSSRAQEESEEEEEEAPVASGARPWLYPNLRVRVIDKAALRGKLYLKKGIVVDVHPGPIADISMEDTRDVVQVSHATNQGFYSSLSVL